MAKVPYTAIGALGGLIGANIAMFILAHFFSIMIPQTSNFFLIGNHIGEAISVVGVLGLVYDLLPRDKKQDPLIISLVAVFAGAVWEWLSFLTGANVVIGSKILLEWFKFGVPVIFVVGLPIILISRYIRKEKKIMGLEVTNTKGLLFNFFICMIYSMVIVSIGISYLATHFPLYFG